MHVPQFALQALHRKHPRWRRGPAAIAQHDRPAAPILELNAPAQALHLQVGMRCAEAKNLAPQLRVAVLDEQRVERTTHELHRALHTFSPRVEIHDEGPGLFFLDPNGLQRIYRSTRSWAHAVHQYLLGRGFTSSVVVGHNRWLIHAVAMQHRGVHALHNDENGPARLEELARGVALKHLHIHPETIQSLSRLGIHTLQHLRQLPPGEVERRFGHEVSRWHLPPCDDRTQLPLQPTILQKEPSVSVEIFPPDNHTERLLFALKASLDELLNQVSVSGHSVQALHLKLTPEHRSHRPILSRIESATPQCTSRLWMELIRLRLDQQLNNPTLTSQQPPHAPMIESVQLRAQVQPLRGEQLNLVHNTGVRRDLAAANRALARIRAAFGDRAVTHGQTRDAHLPEARSILQPLKRWKDKPKARPQSSKSVPNAPSPLVRRILKQPRPLHPLDHRTPEKGPALQTKHMYGPYRISGAWWAREVERDYYYAETASGEIWWMYYDRPRKHWFLQGTVD